jgi:hypothetical protein
MQLAELKTAIATDPKLRAELAEAVLGGRITLPEDIAAELGYGSTSYTALEFIRGADVQARRAQRRVAELEELVRAGFTALGVPTTKLPK